MDEFDTELIIKNFDKLNKKVDELNEDVSKFQNEIRGDVKTHLLCFFFILIYVVIILFVLEFT